MARTLFLVALFATVVAACTGEPEPRASKGDAREVPASTRLRPEGTCSVTLPNGSTPPGEKPSSGHHGNGKIWTGLSPYGVVVAGPDYVRPDGTIWMKFPWWADGVEGDLTIRGRRLDAPARRLRAEIDSGWPETGFSGDAFWASAITFPTEGCWEITGSTGDASLTFVNLVIKSRE